MVPEDGIRVQAHIPVQSGNTVGIYLYQRIYLEYRRGKFQNKLLHRLRDISAVVLLVCVEPLPAVVQAVFKEEIDGFL